MRRTQWSLLMVLLAAPAFGQITGTYLLTSTNAVSPSSATTTIGVWATWTDPGFPGFKFPFLFLSGDYDLTAGEGVFSNPVNVLQGPGSSTGVIAGNVISGAANGQFHLPPLFVGSLDNPILLATYDWTTTNFTPRTVSLDTSNTTSFMILEWVVPNPGPWNLFPGGFSPGSGVINVVPAPAAWILVSLPFVAAARRRRS
ncbi:MAG: hypothetical protein IID31_06990 [Planctomycetes bacterium]|nr:hypothetical protein [Planctomycetota bacterium]